jgi:hypothetical protein
MLTKPSPHLRMCRNVVEIIVVEALLTKIKKLTVSTLVAMLVVVVLLSRLHLGALIAQEIWTLMPLKDG